MEGCNKSFLRDGLGKNMETKQNLGEERGIKGKFAL